MEARRQVLVEWIVVLCVIAVVTLTCTRLISVVRVAGGSMAPALNSGDVCVVDRTDDVDVGDIALFHLSGDSIRTLHRVVSIEGDRLVTQGDANPVADRRLAGREEVSGKVVFTARVSRLVAWWRRA